MNDLIELNNFSLKSYNSMRIDAIAKKVIMPYDIPSLIKAIKLYRDKSIIILGGGANTILSKSYYNDSFVFISTHLMKQIDYAEKHIIAQCGVNLSDLSWFALENSIAGFEFLEDIPGTVGGALIMNAGTYNETIGGLVNKITYYDTELDQLIERQCSISDFFTRGSWFSTKSAIILECKFISRTGNYISILETMLEVKKKRYMKQPRNYPSAGSVFKRPYLDDKPLYVWELLDKVGLRGTRVGDAMISEKHPGFIVNIGKATGSDILELVNLCKERVLKEINIELELEWRVV